MANDRPVVYIDRLMDERIRGTTPSLSEYQKRLRRVAQDVAISFGYDVDDMLPDLAMKRKVSGIFAAYDITASERETIFNMIYDDAGFKGCVMMIQSVRLLMGICGVKTFTVQ